MIMLSRFRFFVAFVLSLIRNCLFLSVLLYVGCRINRINPLLVIVSSKLPAMTNVIHKLLRGLQTISKDN